MSCGSNLRDGGAAGTHSALPTITVYMCDAFLLLVHLAVHQFWASTTHTHPVDDQFAFGNPCKAGIEFVCISGAGGGSLLRELPHGGL